MKCFWRSCGTNSLRPTAPSAPGMSCGSLHCGKGSSLKRLPARWDGKGVMMRGFSGPRGRRKSASRRSCGRKLAPVASAATGRCVFCRMGNYRCFLNQTIFIPPFFLPRKPVYASVASIGCFFVVRCESKRAGMIVAVMTVE